MPDLSEHATAPIQRGRQPSNRIQFIDDPNGLPVNLKAGEKDVALDRNVLDYAERMSKLRIGEEGVAKVFGWGYSGGYELFQLTRPESGVPRSGLCHHGAPHS